MTGVQDIGSFQADSIAQARLHLMLAASSQGANRPACRARFSLASLSAGFDGERAVCVPFVAELLTTNDGRAQQRHCTLGCDINASRIEKL